MEIQFKQVYIKCLNCQFTAVKSCNVSSYVGFINITELCKKFFLFNLHDWLNMSSVLELCNAISQKQDRAYTLDNITCHHYNINLNELELYVHPLLFLHFAIFKIPRVICEIDYDFCDDVDGDTDATAIDDEPSDMIVSDDVDETQTNDGEGKASDKTDASKVSNDIDIISDVQGFDVDKSVIDKPSVQEPDDDKTGVNDPCVEDQVLTKTDANSKTTDSITIDTTAITQPSIIITIQVNDATTHAVTKKLQAIHISKKRKI